MISKTDLATETLSAAAAGAIVALVLDRLKIAPRASAKLRDRPGHDGPREEAEAGKPLLPARFLEGAFAFLLFRLAAGASRKLIHRAV